MASSFCGFKSRISDCHMYVNIKYILEKIFSCYFLGKDSNGFAESEGGQGLKWLDARDDILYVYMRWARGFRKVPGSGQY